MGTQSISSQGCISIAPPKRSIREELPVHLPENDEKYLNEKGYEWELLPEGNGACVIISGFPISTGIFDRDCLDLMIRIPAQYNIASLDKFSVDPEIKIRST